MWVMLHNTDMNLVLHSIVIQEISGNLANAILTSRNLGSEV